MCMSLYRSFFIVVAVSDERGGNDGEVDIDIV